MQFPTIAAFLAVFAATNVLAAPVAEPAADAVNVEARHDTWPQYYVYPPNTVPSSYTLFHGDTTFGGYHKEKETSLLGLIPLFTTDESGVFAYTNQGYDIVKFGWPY